MNYKTTQTYLFFIFIIHILVLQSCGNNRKDKPNGNKTATPTTADSLIQAVSLKRVKIFIENSASIFGYVEGNTDYMHVVNDLAQFSNIISETDAEFNYSLISGNQASLTSYELGNDPNILSSTLSPSGLSRKTSFRSDLNGMFTKVLQSVDKESISMLISDGLYDIGDLTNPLGALETKGIQTRSTFIRVLGRSDIQTIIIKLTSQFNGRYYSSSDGSNEDINQRRPYYVWIFGHKEQLDHFMTDKRLTELKGYSNHAVLAKLSKTQIPYSIISYGNKGLETSRGETTQMHRRGRSVDISFNVAVDFSRIRLNESYFVDPSNYQLDNGFIIENIQTVTELKNSATTALERTLRNLEFTPSHIIKVSRADFRAGDCDIRFIYNLPAWIEESSMNSDRSIAGNDTQTFGLSNLINGISNAYQEVSQTNEIKKITINLTN